ncbi:MAG: hypothetical protein ACTSW1_08425 [Candidatus Hodarchaeales archaeon]
MINKINQLADYIVENAWFNDERVFTRGDVWILKGYDHISMDFKDLNISVECEKIHIEFNYEGTLLTDEKIQECLDKCRELFDAELEKRG